MLAAGMASRKAVLKQDHGLDAAIGYGFALLVASLVGFQAR